MIHDPTNFVSAGVPLTEASRVLLLVHGRGGQAQGMLSLAPHLTLKNTALVAPQATGNTWYPYSFLQPTERNEPDLSSALNTLESLRAQLMTDFSFQTSQLYWLGFSQGACLLLEFLARNPAPYGGIFGLSGGLIGPEGTARAYPGTFGGTPVLLSCSNTDPHIPEPRVWETATVFSRMGAAVQTKIYPNGAHTINEEDLHLVNAVLNPG